MKRWFLIMANTGSRRLLAGYWETVRDVREVLEVVLAATRREERRRLWSSFLLNEIQVFLHYQMFPRAVYF